MSAYILIAGFSVCPTWGPWLAAELIAVQTGESSKTVSLGIVGKGSSIETF